jgi:hypothetical protein
MAYSKTELKSSGDKALPYFRPLWTGNYQTNVSSEVFTAVTTNIFSYSNIEISYQHFDTVFREVTACFNTHTLWALNHSISQYIGNVYMVNINKFFFGKI